MSCQDLGKATYTSAATVMRFCKKFGCKGYPDFKLRFLSDVKGGQILSDSASVQLSERENMVTLLQKVSEVQTRALDATRKALSLSQLHRIQRLLLDNPYLDFYAYDTNIHLARYAGSQFFHAGKIAAVYSETGAIDTLEKDGTCHDPYRIEYLKAHIEQMKKAVEEDGVELMGYTPWGRIDLVYITTGELKKRYGFIYVDKNDDGTGTGKRFKKDFFSWFQNVIRTNGEVL